MKTSDLFKKSWDFLHDYSPGAANIQVHQGGTSSGKTYSILQALFCLSAENPKIITTVAGQDIPNLKAGALRDALSIVYNNPDLEKALKGGSVKTGHNKTDRIFEFTNGSIIEFKSFDSAQDAKSGKRNFLFMNEANGIRWDIWQELEMRCRAENGIGGKSFIDYNPNSGFWAHENVIGQPRVQLVISDHRCNPFIDQDLRDKIEGLKNLDVELWKVYARGLTGRVTGLIFNNWFICNGIPEGAKLIAYGLDFGFTNDETGLIEVYKQDGELWVNEILYKTGLTNQDISANMKHWGISKKDEIIADSAEPKSIEELSRLGWFVKPAKKGPDSVKNSVDILKRYKINVTRASVNLRKELERYKWRTDKTGKTINEPVDCFNHLIDPLRYVALNKLNIRNQKAPTSMLPRHNPPPLSDLPAGFL